MSSTILIPSGEDLALGHLSDVLPVTMTLGRRPVGSWLKELGCLLVSPKALHSLCKTEGPLKPWNSAVSTRVWRKNGDIQEHLH